MMKKESLWCVSNILAGTQEQIDEIMNSNILHKII